MKAIEIKLARIGNSRGIRLPAATIKRYGIGATVVMEQRSDGIFLRATGPAIEKLTWENTAREMEAAGEDWDDWDSLSADGLDDVQRSDGNARRVAEPGPWYQVRKPKERR